MLYIGTVNDGDFRVIVEHEDGNPVGELPGCQDIINHSPSGLSWGYNGSGPAQCALAILYHVTRDKELSLKHYQDFKAQVIANLPMNDDFKMTSSRVEAWLANAVGVDAAD